MLEAGPHQLLVSGLRRMKCGPQGSTRNEQSHYAARPDAPSCGSFIKTRPYAQSFVKRRNARWTCGSNEAKDEHDHRKYEFANKLHSPLTKNIRPNDSYR